MEGNQNAASLIPAGHFWRLQGVKNMVNMVVIPRVGHFQRLWHVTKTRRAFSKTLNKARFQRTNAAKRGVGPRERRQRRMEPGEKPLSSRSLCRFPPKRGKTAAHVYLRDASETGLLTSSGFLPRFSSSIRFSIASGAEIWH